MRIAMIGQKGLPAHSGGVERHVDELVTRLSSAEHEVLAYCRAHYNLNKNLVREYAGAQLIYVPTIKNKYLDTGLYTLLASIDVLFRKVDVVHYHAIGPAFFSWIPRLFAPHTKVIVTYHCQDYFHGKWGPFARFMLRVAERIACAAPHELIVVSKSLKRHVKRQFGRTALYIPNSVTLPNRRMPKKITRYGLTRGNYILLVTRLVPHKGVHYAIEAYKMLARIMPNIPKLVIAGEGAHTDAYVAKLKAMAKHNPNILMVGARTGEFLEELYSNAKLFVQPSESEGLSIALLEAMSYGCPVLVSDIAENKEVLPAVGYTFRNKSVQDLTEQMHGILTSPRRTKTAAILNREHIAQYYDASMIFQKALRLYRQQVS